MRPKSPQSTNLEWQTDYFRSPVDQTKIRYAVYQSKTVEPKRFIVFLNGRTEWIEKYEQIPQWLDLPPGYAFLTWDHRGQGASEGRQAHVDSYNHFAEDTAALIEHVVGDRPYGIIAHSMGGLISLYTTLLGKISPAFLALSSPLLMLPNTPVKRSISKPLSKVLTRSPLRFQHTGVSSMLRQKFHGNSLTHSFQGFNLVVRSHYHNLSPTFGWVHASFEAIAFVNNPVHLKNLSCPTLIICGSQEKIVDYLGFPQWVMKARQYADVSVDLIKIPAARHEILNEIPRYRNQAIKKMIAWAKESHFFTVKAVQQESMSG
ncbi:MAG: alpha/beta fold hydrolase [Oligoflexus sp.]